MGLLDRLRGREPSATIIATALPGGACLGVVGESHYQPALQRAAKSAVKGKPPLPVTARVAAEKDLLWFQAALVREPDNKYDPNAIAVHAAGIGKIGHLSREHAEDYQGVMDAIEADGSQSGACSAFLRKADNGMWGVVLALSSPDICARDIETTK